MVDTSIPMAILSKLSVIYNIVPMFSGFNDLYGYEDWKTNLKTFF